MNTEMPPTIPDTIVEQQRAVQRKLGRCLLRLQQYELLLKAMVAHTEISGPPEQLEARRARNVACAQRKTMGTLVGRLTDDYMTTDSTDATDNDEADTTGGMWARFRIQMQFSTERYDATKSALNELVDLRNELVHHFVSRFNIGQADGCAAADTYLDESYETIDGHLLTLRGWAEDMDNTRAMMASFMETSTFEDLVINGIRPDGSVNWPISGIVSCLRQAEGLLAKRGWTGLNEAIAWIRQHEPDQTPNRYGCGSWRQVIHESKQFEIRKQPFPTGGPTLVLYRSRTKAAPPQSVPKKMSLSPVGGNSAGITVSVTCTQSGSPVYADVSGCGWPLVSSRSPPRGWCITR